MVLEHHGYLQIKNRQFGYKKEPIETRFFRVNSHLGDSGYYVLSKDWDTGRMDDFIDSEGINEGTYHIRRIGEYEWALENWKMRYMFIEDDPDSLISKAVLKQSEVDKILNNTTKEIIEVRDGCYMLSDDYDEIIYNTGQYLYQPLAYPRRETADNTKNLFDINESCNILGLVGSNYEIRQNQVSMIIDTRQKKEWTLSFSEIPIDLIIMVVHDSDIPQNNKPCGVMSADMLDLEPAENGRFYIHINAISDYMLIMLGDIQPVAYYEKIGTMIEAGHNTNPAFVPHFNKTAVYGWRIPKVEDWCQLFGMSGSLDSKNIMRSVFSSVDDIILPYTGINIGDDVLGCRITTSGQRNDLTGEFYDYGRAAYYATYWQAATTDVPFNCPTLSLRPTEDKYKIILDNGKDVPEGILPTKSYFRNVRLCRPLSDEELGYKLLIDEINDKICVVSYKNYVDGNLPDEFYNYRSLERGTLRGLAVRSMSLENKTISRSYSELQREVNKTGNNGSYGWWGFDEYIN